MFLFKNQSCFQQQLKKSWIKYLTYEMWSPGWLPEVFNCLHNSYLQPSTDVEEVTTPVFLWQIMMTSSNGNIFRVTGPLCGEFTSHRWIPLLCETISTRSLIADGIGVLILIGREMNRQLYAFFVLIHWGRVTHICVSKLTVVGSDNGLPPGRRQAIVWTNAEILLIGPSGTCFRNLNRNSYVFIQENAFCKMAAICFWPQCVKQHDEVVIRNYPDSKVHGANMGPMLATWTLLSEYRPFVRGHWLESQMTGNTELLYFYCYHNKLLNKQSNLRWFVTSL